MTDPKTLLSLAKLLPKIVDEVSDGALQSLREMSFLRGNAPDLVENVK